MKLTREQNKGCKLTDNDIYNIRREYKMCRNYTLLGRVYNVSKTAIRYWVKEGCREEMIDSAKISTKRMQDSLSEEGRKKLNKRRHALEKTRNDSFPEYDLGNKLKNRDRSKKYNEIPEVKIKKIEYRKEYNSRPEVKLRSKIYYKDYMRIPEVRIKRKESWRKYNAKPEVKLRNKEYYKRKLDRLI